MKIEFIDRITSKKCVEKVFGEKALLYLYGDGFFSKFFASIISKVSFFSKFYGWLQKRPASKKKVAPFIKNFNIDFHEFLTQDFVSFNDFFIRKLNPRFRPIIQDSNVVIAPADGRYFVYPQISQFQIKGKEFSLASFLENQALTNRYRDGSMAIIRLCPVDYHRFHFPVDGRAGRARRINGSLYSVSPIALKKNLSILSENKRVITEIETEFFGTILYIEIGATFVGSIHQTYTPNSQVTKGDEKGYFEFGGSCIVLLFEKGQIVFDPDLIANTQIGLETKINFGQSLAFNNYHKLI